MHQDYEYYRYNSGSQFRDYIINFNNPLIKTSDTINAVEIMKIGVFQNHQYDDFYKVDINGVKLLGLSSSNKYIVSNEDKEFIKLTNLDKSYIELQNDTDNLFEKESRDIINDSIYLRKNFYKSVIGNILNLPPNKKMRLHTLLNNLQKIYQQYEYDLLVFGLTCRK
jgi:hypothetical protein